MCGANLGTFGMRHACERCHWYFEKTSFRLHTLEAVDPRNSISHREDAANFLHIGLILKVLASKFRGGHPHPTSR